MDHDEIELIRRAQAGERDAFDALVRLHDRRVLQVAHGILGNAPDAHDAAQETFIRAWERLRSFRGESAFSTWLTRIAVNQSLNQRKRRRWKRRLSLEALRTRSGDAFEPEAAEAADARSERRELQDGLQRGMDLLSDRERAVFVLKHEHGYKLREIALMLGCAEGTVKNYLFRGTQKLRGVLAPFRAGTFASR